METIDLMIKTTFVILIIITAVFAVTWMDNN